jgi:hypothetical protein
MSLTASVLSTDAEVSEIANSHKAVGYSERPMVADASDTRPSNNAVKAIRILDMDQPLYRIFPLWFFEDALYVNNGRLVLIPPARWEDPFEDPCASIIMRMPDHSQKTLSTFLCQTYAQCWSLEGGSDSLLRAYSRVTKDTITGRNVEPRYEGVKVRTSPRKLIESVNAFIRTRDHMSFYLGAIEYRDDVAQTIVNRLARIGPFALGKSVERAESLLLKRKAFQHEAEVRLICVADPGVTPTEYMGVDIDKNFVFEEIEFDPRLARFERIEREKRVRSLGYKGRISDGLLYQKTFFDVKLDRTWDEP